MCTWSKHLRIFTVLECTPPFNTEVVLVYYEWQNFCTCWICSFSVKLPSWDLAWMLWQKFLDICLFKNPLAKFRAAELSCIFQTFLNSWALLTSLKSWFYWKPNIIICVLSAECELLMPSDQMAASVQIYPFLAKTSTSVHIAPIS